MIAKEGEITGHSGAIYDLAKFENAIFSASADGYIARWNLDTLQQDSFAIKCTTPPYSVAVTDSHLWFGLSSGDIHVIDLAEKKEIKFFQQHRSAIFSIVSIPSKNIVLVADADGNLSAWDSTNLSLLLFLPLNCGKIRKINVREDGEVFVVHGQDEKIRIFETQQFNEIVTLKGHELGANCSVFSKSDKNILISGGKDGHLKIWDWSSEKLLEAIPAHNFALYDLAILPFGNSLLSASRDKSIKLWDASTFHFQQKMELKQGGHKHSVNSICPIDNERFATCSDDRKIILWKIT